jgi:hypothetical protein
MSDGRQSAEEKKEAAAIRRRWITLGEVLAVVAVLISGLTLWNSYQERNSAEAERAASKQEEKAKAKTLVLRAAADKEGKRLTVTALDQEQAIQSQTIAFPTALGASAVDSVIAPRIEAKWLEAPAKKVRSAEGKETAGDRRMPVAITTSFVSEGETYNDTALYDIGYKLEGGGLLDDVDVTLRGLSLIEHVPATKAKARLDSIWASRSK